MVYGTVFLCSVAAGCDKVGEGCSWMTVLVFGHVYWSNERRTTAVDALAWNLTSDGVLNVLPDRADGSVLEVCVFLVGNCSQSWCHVVVCHNRDGDVIHACHLVCGDGDRHHNRHHNHSQNGPVVCESTPVHGLTISLDYIAPSCVLSLCCNLFLCCYTGTRFQEQVRQEVVLQNHSVLCEFRGDLHVLLPSVGFWLRVGLCVGAQRLAF